VCSSQEGVIEAMQNLINFHPKNGDSIFFSKHQKNIPFLLTLNNSTLFKFHELENFML